MGKLLDELKKRNVIRVAIAYLVVAWLLVQVSANLESALNLPEWFDSFVISLLVIGIIPVLLFSWAFEITEDGIKRESQIDRATFSNHNSSKKLNLVTIIAAATVLAIFTWDKFELMDNANNEDTKQSVETAQSVKNKDGTVTVVVDEPNEMQAQPSIAVLPFADFSAKKDQAYFSDGISEEILNVLARVDGLKVASRTSSFSYRGSDINLKKVAQELAVDYLLEGSVRTAGDSIRVTAQLIKSETDQHLWSDTFDYQLSVENLFKIQDEIAKAVVSSIGGKISGQRLDTLKYLAAAETKNLNAYKQFLQARGLFSIRTDGNIVSIIDKLEAVLAIEPVFPRASETLAAAYHVVQGYPARFGMGISQDELKQRTLKNAEDALANAPHLVLSQAIIASYEMTRGGYYQVISQLVVQDPNEAILWNWRGQTALHLGYFEQAERSLLQCLEIDKGNRTATQSLILAYIYQNRVDEAYELWKQEQVHVSTPHLYLFLVMLTKADMKDEIAFLVTKNQNKLTPLDLLQAVLDENFDHDAGYIELGKRFEEAYGEAPKGLVPLTGFLIMFKQYESLVNGESEPIAGDHWYVPHEDYKNSKALKTVIKKYGIFQDWKDYGIAPHCRFVGADDFECEF